MISGVDEKQLLLWKDDPVRFVVEALGVKPDVWQILFMSAIKSNDRVSCRSGHGTGKSASVSWIIMWFLFTRYPAKVTVTAPKSDQLQDIIWSEIAIWRRRLPKMMRDNLIIQSDKIYIAGLDKENFAVARTARKETPEGFQGQHSKNQLTIVDEASGVVEAIYEVIEGTMTTEGSKLVLIGNPTRLKGYFYDSHHKDKKRWRRLRVNAEKAKMVDPNWLDYMRLKYGTDSNIYRVRVLGEFPTEDEGSVIPLYLVEEARCRDLAPSDMYPTVWGVDVARQGDNRSALAKRRGDRQLEPVQWRRNLSTTECARWIREEYEMTKVTHPELVPLVINIDVIGLGAGVYDTLNDASLPVAAVNVAEQPSFKHKYENLRAELWFSVREWLETKRVSLCYEDEELLDELTLPRYDMPRAKVRVEGKRELKLRGEASPDLADSFVLTFASGHNKLYKEVNVNKDSYRESYRKARMEEGSWMTL